MLESVKKALNITGDYQDNALSEWINETIEYLKDAGVKESDITAGLVARGVSDLWNYGSGKTDFSAYFKQRAAQLAYKR